MQQKRFVRNSFLYSLTPDSTNRAPPEKIVPSKSLQRMKQAEKKRMEQAAVAAMIFS